MLSNAEGLIVCLIDYGFQSANQYSAALNAWYFVNLLPMTSELNQSFHMGCVQATVMPPSQRCMHSQAWRVPIGGLAATARPRHLQLLSQISRGAMQLLLLHAAGLLLSHGNCCPKAHNSLFIGTPASGRSRAKEVLHEREKVWAATKMHQTIYISRLTLASQKISSGRVESGPGMHNVTKGHLRPASAANESTKAGGSLEHVL